MISVNDTNFPLRHVNSICNSFICKLYPSSCTESHKVHFRTIMKS